MVKSLKTVPMKTGKWTIIFLAVLMLVSCSNKETVGYDKKQAFENYSVCRQLADSWLKKLDSTDYSHVKSIQPLTSVYDMEISSFISEARTVYGKITERKLLGAHMYFYSNQSLLTYVPEIDERYLAHIHAVRSEDGFYSVLPKYFGLRSHKQMFSGLPEGDYVVLMYKVLPTNKSYAEERLTFIRARWNNSDRSWRLADYKIADEI